MNELALFAGAGGGILASKLLGHRIVCAVEIESYAASILAARQNNGILPPFPIWDDICTFDGKPWQGIIELVSAGFPCQDISAAGRGEGIKGKRSGLWKEAVRIIREVGPSFVFLENSPLLTKRGLDIVLGDLASMGFDAEWCVLGGDNFGAWHHRKRIWILAADNRQERIQRIINKKISGQFGIPWRENVRGFEDFMQRSSIYSPKLCRGGNGMADYVDRIAAIGNGQIPVVAANAFVLLMERLKQKLHDTNHSL